MADSQPFVVERYAQPPAEFNGWLIADQSNEGPHRDRWTEIRIYASDTGRFIVEQLGMSRRQGDVTLRDVDICETADEVHRALRRDDKGRRYVTDIAIDALRQAASYEPKLNVPKTERV